MLKDKNEITNSIEEVEKNKEDANKDLAIIKNSVMLAEKELSNLKETIEKLDEEIKKNLSAKSETRLLKQRIDDIEQEIKKISSEIKDILNEINMLNSKIKEKNMLLLKKKQEELENERESIASKNGETIGLLAGLEKSLTDIKQSTAKKDLIKKEIENKSQEIKLLEMKAEKIQLTDDKIKKLQIMQNQIKNNYEINSKLIKESQDIINNIDQIKKCPTCFQEVTLEHKKKIIFDEKKKISDLSKKINQGNSELDEIKPKLNDFEKIMAEGIDAREKLVKIKIELNLNQNELIEISRKEKELTDIENNIRTQKNITLELAKKQEKINNNLDIMKEDIKILESVNEKNSRINMLKKRSKELEEEKVENKSKVSALEAFISKHKSKEDEFKKAKDEFDEKSSKVNNLKVQFGKLEVMSLNFEKNLERLNKELLIIEKQEKNISELKTKEAWLRGTFSELMHVLERKIMINMYIKFNELFTNWFRMLLEDETINARITDDFSPVIEMNGHEIEIVNLSGGEKTSVALAYRLALNRIINDFIHDIKTKGLIILDEPTDGFSNDQLDKVRDVIGELGMRQVIIVSHDPKVETFVGNIIKISKDNFVSSVVAY